MILEFKNIRLKYDRNVILNGIDISINRGRVQALIGPNGAGKSSTMRVISGLSVATDGTAIVDGVQQDHIFDVRKHCGFLIESPQFYNYLTGIENLKILIRLNGSNDDPNALLEKVGLGPHKKKKFKQYSRGMKQRLGIAQALIGNPKFLVLDEPFHGLDPEVKDNFIKLIRELADSGIGVLITSHLLSEIESIADDFILLNNGKVFLSGKMSDYSGEKQHVKLFFDKSLPSEIKLKHETTQGPKRLDAFLTRSETEELIKELGGLGLIPYKVERSSILYDKYMEIAL